MRLRKGIGPLLILTSFCLLTQRPAAGQVYSVTDLGTLAGTLSYARSINDSGLVAGFSTTEGDTINHAFLWEGGTIHDLGTLGGSNSVAAAVNNSSQIFGLAEAIQNEMHATMWFEGETRDLGTLGGEYSLAFGANSPSDPYNTVAVGMSEIAALGELHAFSWTEENGMADLGTLGGDWSYAIGANNLEQIIGAANTPHRDLHAVMWYLGWTIDLGTLGGTESVAWGMSNPGAPGRTIVVGWSDDSNLEVHAFAWTADEGMKDLGTLDGHNTMALDVQEVTVFPDSPYQIVGSTMNLPWTDPDHAFIWDETFGMRDLNNLIPLDSGWELNQAFGINTLGEIAGGGTVGGESHGFLLTPIPLNITGPTPGQAGMDNTLTVMGANPGEWIRFCYGFQSGSTPIPGCQGESVDILDPVIVGTVLADTTGTASFTAFVPDGAGGLTVLFQAVERTTCRATNLVSFAFR